MAHPNDVDVLHALACKEHVSIAFWNKTLNIQCKKIKMSSIKKLIIQCKRSKIN
jgi:hypothetical protein